jgi:hypothetical protein
MRSSITFYHFAKKAQITCGAVAKGKRLPFDFFGPKWHSLRSLSFQGTKKSQFSVPTPSNGPCNGFAHIKIITSRAIINNSYTLISVMELGTAAKKSPTQNPTTP